MDKKIELRLLAAAAAASTRAYAPYSGFRVGAAMLCSGGRSIATGCNVENASFGLTVCAERMALYRAVADGHRRFGALAVVCAGEAPVPPCGACLQVLAEFCPSGLPIILAASGRLRQIERCTLGVLLPRAFRLKS